MKDIAIQDSCELIVECGAQDMQSEMERLSHLFRHSESGPGLTRPTMLIGGGNPTQHEVPVWHPGSGHTRGDTLAWVEKEKLFFSGDLVAYEVDASTGDAQLPMSPRLW